MAGTPLVERLLNIKKTEIKFVRTLFLHNFFQGFSLALFYTAANATFLSSFPVTKLPLVYILSAVVLIVVGLGYSSLEERLPVKSLLKLSAIVLVLSTFIMWTGLYFLNVIWVGFIIMIWYRINALISSLEFWGISSTLFDVRQSKRLFGVISSGEITAKLIGYLSVSAIVGLIGYKNIVLVAAISFLISYYFLLVVLKQQKIKIQEAEIQRKDFESNKVNDSIFKKFFSSDFIVLLSILSFLAVISFTFIDFSFLTNVKKMKGSNPAELAKFLGLFFAFTKGITFLVKLFFTSRLIDLLGVKKSLLMLPVLFLTVTLAIIIYDFTFVENTYLIFMFGFLMILLEIFRYSIHEPVFFSLFQPLQKNLRMFGQAIVNGVLNPLASGLAGLALLIIFKIHKSVDLNLVSYILFLILSGWIVVVILTNRQYIIVLQNAVKKRIFQGTEMAVKGKIVTEILKSKLTSNYPEEVIYSTELLIKSEPNEINNVFIQLLKHPSENVQIYVLQKIEEQRIKYLKKSVLEIINDGYSAKVKQAAIKAYCLIDENAVDKINPFLEHPEPLIKEGAISGLLNNGGLEAVVLSGQQLLKLINSDKPQDKITAAQIMGKLKIKNFYQPIVSFFESKNQDVVSAAIEASGEIKNEKLIPFLIFFLEHKIHHEKAAKSLAKYGEIAVDAIYETLKSLPKDTVNKQMIYKFCQVCGMIGGRPAYNLLLEFMEFSTSKIQYEAISSLKKSGYKAFGNETKIRFKFEELFSRASWLYQAKDVIQRIEPDSNLSKAFDIEIDLIKDSLFNILSFLYDTRTIFKAKEGLLTGYSEKQANALEIIDNLISKKMSSKFALILEDLTDEERITKLKTYPPVYNVTIQNILNKIITEKDKLFNRWTIVCALKHIENESDASSYIPLMLSLTNDNVKFVKEASIVTIKTILSKQSNSIDINKLIGKEKYLQIMEPTTETNTLLDFEKVIILKSTSLFSETPENILVDVASILKEIRVDEGRTIFNKGDMGFNMYIINEGEISIHDDKLTFAVLKNRDFFGELALLDPEPRSASATALKDTLLLRLDQDAFYELMAERMEVAKGILKILCRRIRDQNDKLTELKNQAIAAQSS